MKQVNSRRASLLARVIFVSALVFLFASLFSIESRTIHATETDSIPSINHEIDQSDADHVKKQVDAFLYDYTESSGYLSRSDIPEFAGYYYEGNHLHILCTSTRFREAIEQHIRVELQPFFTTHRVAHSLSELHSLLEPAMEAYGALEASIDIRNNQIELGLPQDSLSKYGQTVQLNSVTVALTAAQSTTARPAAELRTLSELRVLQKPDVLKHRPLIAKRDQLQQTQYELWGGDGLGRVDNYTCTLTVRGLGMVFQRY